MKHPDKTARSGRGWLGVLMSLALVAGPAPAAEEGPPPGQPGTRLATIQPPVQATQRFVPPASKPPPDQAILEETRRICALLKERKMTKMELAEHLGTPMQSERQPWGGVVIRPTSPLFKKGVVYGGRIDKPNPNAMADSIRLRLAQPRQLPLPMMQAAFGKIAKPGKVKNLPCGDLPCAVDFPWRKQPSVPGYRCRLSASISRGQFYGAQDIVVTAIDIETLETR